MKHYTHIYIAKKSIELMYDALKNLHKYKSGRKAADKWRTDLRKRGKVLQRLLNYYEDEIGEASWAPDDILNDKMRFHTFKLFTKKEFTDYETFIKETHKVGRKIYYRAKGGGGLPYRVDHLTRFIGNMIKLRDYNDGFSMQQIMYMFFLLSHYVADAHVPMHCDIRDDKPSKKKPGQGKYYSTKWHDKIEQRWENACTPLGKSEGLFEIHSAKVNTKPTPLTPSLKFRIGKGAGIKKIKTYHIEDGEVMDFMIWCCAKSKERSLKLFPTSGPNNFNEKIFKNLTREIFADSIGALISIWVHIWEET